MFIAEVKTRSPFGFQSRYTWDELFEVAEKYGNAIAIHTDPRWGGSLEHLRRARSLTTKPILAKGIHATDELLYQVFDCLPDFTLVVGRRPNLDIEHCCWIEANDIEHLQSIPSYQTIVWNARDLQTGKPKAESWADARGSFFGHLCQASFIRHPSDVHSDADSYIVGEHLMEFVQEKFGSV